MSKSALISIATSIAFTLAVIALTFRVKAIRDVVVGA